MAPANVRSLATLLQDASGDADLLASAKAALALLPLHADLDALAREHLEHLRWIEERRAFWRSPPSSSALSGLTLAVQGGEHALQTTGHPTVVITPMTIAYEDVLWVINALAADREVAIYGEGLTGDAIFAELDAVCSFGKMRLARGPRDILAALDANGFFLTYPDFVYEGHAVRHASFFGMQWPFSAAFLRICARPGTMLLPVSMRRDGGTLTVRFDEPLYVDAPRHSAIDRRWSDAVVAATVARLLEGTILANPAQWQLLLTMVAQCERRAR